MIVLRMFFVKRLVFDFQNPVLAHRLHDGLQIFGALWDIFQQNTVGHHFPLTHQIAHIKRVVQPSEGQIFLNRGFVRNAISIAVLGVTNNFNVEHRLHHSPMYVKSAQIKRLALIQM